MRHSLRRVLSYWKSKNMSSYPGSTSWGIVGGMGPLASAEFVRTIYEMSADCVEQTAPHVFLLSDPSFPDRTHALATGEQRELVARLSAAVTRVLAQGASAVVVCCVTIHSVFDQLPEELRSSVVPLTDIILRAAGEDERRHLLLCTKGCREARVFEKHPLWPAARGRVVLPSDADQEAVHELIYAIKRGCWRPREAAAFIRGLIQKYECDRAIAGCTELHLVSKRSLERRDSLPLFDPLMKLAAEIAATKMDTRKGRTECAE
jgi:aspartate racemase